MQLNYKDYLEAKRSAGITYKTKKSLWPKVNGRSADYVMSAPVVGCGLSCSFCYVARHRPFGNPVEQYVNLDEILATTKEHLWTLPKPKKPNQTGNLYTYDTCEGSDALTGENIKITNKIVSYFIDTMPEAMTTFATKLTNYKGLREGNYTNTRIRLSLMPENIRKVVEFGTATTEQRIKSIDKFYERGWEVHVNFSPIILTETWLSDYKDLLIALNAGISNKVKEQLKCEVIFLTHTEKLSQANRIWNPKGEDLLWRPELQKIKPTNNRGSNDILNYKNEIRYLAINYFRQLVQEYLPYCFIRYIF